MSGVLAWYPTPCRACRTPTLAFSASIIVGSASLACSGHPERDDNRVRGADDGKGKLLSQVGDKN
jgi:hypothetical protein